MATPIPNPSSGVRDIGSALKYLDSLRNAERMVPADARPLLSLTSMRRLAAALWPADGVPNRQAVVHIAGSKGKGTVAAMVGAGLRAAGFKVGVYTSPHLVNITERIAIDGLSIPDINFANLLRYIAGVEERSRGEGPPATQFEVMTAAAFEYFNFEKCGVVVLETGLGGEHDATNIVDPMLSIITAIQLEHTELLGNTLREIARAKAGIIKAGVPALTFTQGEDVMDVLNQQADALGCALFVLEDNYNCYFEERSGSMKLSPRPGRPEGAFTFAPALPGRVNAFNAALAFIACELSIDLLAERKCNPPGTVAPARPRGPTMARVLRALVQTAPPGRFDRRTLEVTGADGTITTVDAVIDGAHTPESLSAFLGAASVLAPHGLCVIFGCALDKRVDEMLAILAGAAARVHFVTSPRLGARAHPASGLAQKFERIVSGAAKHSAIRWEVSADLAEAVGKVNSQEAPVCICGSFAVAGEALAFAVMEK